MEITEEKEKQQLDEQKLQQDKPQPQEEHGELQPQQGEPTPVPSNEADEVETQSTQVVKPEENREPVANEIEESKDTVVEETQPQEKMISQGEVDRIIQARIAKVKAKASEEAREAARKEFFERYGVGDDNELDEMFGNGQKYKILNDEFGCSQKELEALRAENALLKSGVREEKFNDVRAVLTFNGQPVTVESIAAAAETHPEWFSDSITTSTATGADSSTQAQTQATKPSIIKSVGSGPSTPVQEKSEKELAFEQMGLYK